MTLGMVYSGAVEPLPCTEARPIALMCSKALAFPPLAYFAGSPFADPPYPTLLGAASLASLTQICSELVDHRL